MAAERATVTVPDVRRDQMLRAAAELIGERGFSETRIADVARRSGASPALVIYYFGTKDQLLTEALRYSEDLFYASVAAQLDAMPTARARLELLVRLTCIPQGDGEIPGAWGLWFDLWAQAFRHPEVAKDRIELDQRWRDTIARVVREGQATGEIAPTSTSTTFALTFAALLDGLSIQVALEDPSSTRTRRSRSRWATPRGELGFDWKPPPTAQHGWRRLTRRVVGRRRSSGSSRPRRRRCSRRAPRPCGKDSAHRGARRDTACDAGPMRFGTETSSVCPSASLHAHVRRRAEVDHAVHDAVERVVARSLAVSIGRGGERDAFGADDDLGRARMRGAPCTAARRRPEAGTPRRRRRRR